MADSRYIVDILLKARDETAAAFASALGNQKAFQALTKENERANDSFARSVDRVSEKIKASQAELKRQREALKGVGDASLDAQVKLERAAQAYGRMQADAKASDAQRAQALRDLLDAQDALTKSLSENEQMTARVARQHAVTITNINTEIERTQALARVHEEAAQQRQRQLEDEEALRKRLGEMEQRQADADHAARVAQWEDQQEFARRREETERNLAVVREEIRRQQIELDRRAAQEQAELQSALGQMEQRQYEERIARLQANHEARQAQLREQLQAEQELVAVRDSLAQMEQRQADELAAKQTANWEARQAQLQRETEERRKQVELQRELAEIEADLARQRDEINKKRLDDERELQSALMEMEDRRAREEEAGRIANWEAEQARARRERDLWAQRAALPRQYLESLQQIQRLESQRIEAQDRGDLHTMATVEIDMARAREQAAQLATELRAAVDHLEANVDLDGGEALAHAAALREELELILGHVEINADLDIGSALMQAELLRRELRSVGNDADNAGGKLGLVKGAINAMTDGFDKGSGRIASFDNFLRGLMSLGVATFLEQLALLATAAAGALTALASSAAYAGAAIGGALTAGIAQALPMLGIFATYLYRMKAVMDAANQAQLLQQQQSYQGAKANKRIADTTDAVRSAQDRLAGAHKRVADAQRNLNDAREQARQKLEDLILAERGATLSVAESQEAIRRAVASGDVGSLPRAFLRRDEATVNLRRTRGELGARRAGASPEVDRARDQLNSARQSADEAERALERARRGADIAGANVTAAAGKLEFLLGRMSGAERQLYRTLMRLQDVFRGWAQVVTEPLIRETDRAFHKIITLLQDPRLTAAATRLSQAMADSFGKMFDFATSNEAIDQWLRIIDQAQKNLKPLTDIAINLGRAFMDAAEAAGPALHEIVLWIRDISDDIAKFFRSGRESGKLTDFFREGVKHLKAWAGLMWQIVRLFAALAGPGGGAKTGLEMVNGMAERIGKWADAINDADSKTSQFFQNFFDLSKRMLAALAPIFTSLGKQIQLTFNEDGLHAVEGFTTFIADVLIPAIFGFARVVGDVTAALGDLFQKFPVLSQIARAFIEIALAISIFGRVKSIFTPFTHLIGYLLVVTGLRARFVSFMFTLVELFLTAAGRARLFAGAMMLLSRAGMLFSGPVGWVVLALSIIIPLLAKFGVLDDVVRGIGNAFKFVAGIVGDAISGIVGFVDKLLDKLGPVGDVLKKVIEYSPTGLIVKGVKGVGHAIGSLFGSDDAEANQRKKMATFRELVDKFNVSLEDAQKLAKAGIDVEVKDGKLVDLQKRLDEANAKLEEMKRQNETTNKSTKRLWEQFEDGDHTLRNVRFFVSQTTGVIKDRLGKDTDEGRKAMAKNFRRAADAVKDSMRESGKTTKEGLALIKKYMVKALVATGYSEAEAENLYDHHTRQTNKPGQTGLGQGLDPRGAATGGWIGFGGERGRDAVPTWLGRGEAVLNWAHQKVVNSALWNQFGTTLDGLFKGTRALHAGTLGRAIGFAAGGRAGGVPSQVSLSGVHPALIRAALAIIQRFPGLIVTSGTGGGHAVGSWHYKGRAIDIGGAADVMNRASAWIRGSSIARALTEGIHNPNLSIADGRSVPSSYWGAETWANHANHIHIAIAGALGKIAGALNINKLIPRVRSTANGLMGPLQQRTFDNVRRAAIRAVENSMGGTGVGDRAFASNNFKGPWVQRMGQIANEMGWNLGDWRWLVNAESSGNPEAVNPSSGAFGLGQFLGATKAAYAKFGATSHNPIKQIEAMAKYILDRYGNPTRAKAFHLANNWYAGGGFIGGPIGAAVPIMAHAGEWVLNKLQQSRLASMLGTNVSNLRGAIGISTTPKSAFVDGGEVQRLRGIRRGSYALPAITPQDLDSLNIEVDRLFRAVRNLRRVKVKERMDRFIASISEATKQDGLFDTIDNAIDRFGQSLERSLSLAEVGFKRVNGKFVRRRGGPLLDAIKIAERTIDNYEAISKKLGDERGDLTRALSRTEAKIRQIRRGGIDKDEQDTYAALIGARNNLRERIRNADDAFIDTQQKILQAQEDLKKAQEEAAQARLDALQKEIDAVENAATRANTGFDLRGRLADLREGVGDRLGAVTARAGISAERSGNIRNQITAFGDLLTKARALGDPEMIAGLEDKLAELGVALQESEAATRELNYTYRDVATDIITGRANRATGILGIAGDIFQKLGSIAGTPNTQALLAVANAVKNTLAGAAQQIIGNVNEAISTTFSSNGPAGSVLAQLAAAFAQGPQAFGQALLDLGPTIAQLESTMGDAEKTTFQAIIASMTDNTLAVLDNTATLDDLTGQMKEPQSFSSTAWQWFREAIFNGMGDVLPAYAFPQAETGAFVQKSGLVGVHRGEFIVNPARNNMSMRDGDINIEINEAGGPIDVTHLASRLSFERKTRR